jgi:hypothetical protein
MRRPDEELRLHSARVEVLCVPLPGFCSNIIPPTTRRGALLLTLRRVPNSPMSTCVLLHDNPGNSDIAHQANHITNLACLVHLLPQHHKLRHTATFLGVDVNHSTL